MQRHWLGVSPILSMRHAQFAQLGTGPLMGLVQPAPGGMDYFAAAEEERKSFIDAIDLIRAKRSRAMRRHWLEDARPVLSMRQAQFTQPGTDRNGFSPARAGRDGLFRSGGRRMQKLHRCD